jgi:hypothetical protein
VLRDESLKDLLQFPRKRFSTNVLFTNALRPWGRNGELVYCYAITLEALLKDAPPNKYVRKYRPSLWALTKARLPITVFDYTPEMLKDAIAEFVGPYGKVAEIEDAVRNNTVIIYICIFFNIFSICIFCSSVFFLIG